MIDAGGADENRPAIILGGANAVIAFRSAIGLKMI
jgi:hypothetical protein